MLEEVANKYGPVFTMWLGPEPMVIVSDIDIGREVFRKNEFSGRPSNNIFGEFDDGTFDKFNMFIFSTTHE